MRPPDTRMSRRTKSKVQGRRSRRPRMERQWNWGIFHHPTLARSVVAKFRMLRAAHRVMRDPESNGPVSQSEVQLSSLNCHLTRPQTMRNDFETRPIWKGRQKMSLFPPFRKRGRYKDAESASEWSEFLFVNRDPLPKGPKAFPNSHPLGGRKGQEVPYMTCTKCLLTTFACSKKYMNLT